VTISFVELADSHKSAPDAVQGQADSGDRQGQDSSLFYQSSRTEQEKGSLENHMPVPRTSTENHMPAPRARTEALDLPVYSFMKRKPSTSLESPPKRSSTVSKCDSSSPNLGT
jgi:hypothetical protein